jgi:predicted metal-dependent hydrolase
MRQGHLGGAILVPMTSLTVRRLLADLNTPPPRHWAGDAFGTAFFNALSMSFPLGEQLFIESVKKGLAALPQGLQARFAEEVQGFIGQEATHRQVHSRFNAHLERQGLVNRWERRIQARRPDMEALDVRNWVAITAATEHLTAVFAEFMLRHPQVLASAPQRLQDLWMWHSAEESEHRSTAFDLYAALGGTHPWRVGIFRVVLRHFLIDLARQTLRNLCHDGSWWWPSTWAGAWRLLHGRDGFMRFSRARWQLFLREDFHPSQGDGALAHAWLTANAARVPPVRTST